MALITYDHNVAVWRLRPKGPPLSVVLTHMCLMPRGATATTMSVTHRFRNKFITVVIYKPRLARRHPCVIKARVSRGGEDIQ